MKQQFAAPVWAFDITLCRHWSLRLFVGFWSFGGIEIPLCLSWPRKPSIACCTCWGFRPWIWLYTCWMWCRWTHWLNYEVRTELFNSFQITLLYIMYYCLLMLLKIPKLLLSCSSLTYGCRCVLDPGDKILDCPPTFTMYEFDAAVNGALVVKGKYFYNSSWFCLEFHNPIANCFLSFLELFQNSLLAVALIYHYNVHMLFHFSVTLQFQGIQILAWM